MSRPEIEKTKLAAGVQPTVAEQELLKDITGTVLYLNGGVGVLAEYLSKKGCDVTLTDSDRLSFSYRRSILEDSKVKCWNTNSSDIKLSKPCFDYVLIRSMGDLGLAHILAKKGIINLLNMEIINVINTKPVSNKDTKVDGDIKANS